MPVANMRVCKYIYIYIYIPTQVTDPFLSRQPQSQPQQPVQCRFDSRQELHITYINLKKRNCAIFIFYITIICLKVY